LWHFCHRLGEFHRKASAFFETCMDSATLEKLRAMATNRGPHDACGLATGTDCADHREAARAEESAFVATELSRRRQRHLRDVADRLHRSGISPSDLAELLWPEISERLSTQLPNAVATILEGILDGR
jgi:hypothetical protein